MSGDGGDAVREDWDSALNRLLEGVNLDDLSIPLSSETQRVRLTFDAVHDRVADQLRDKVRSERMRRDAVMAIRRQFEESSLVIDEALGLFVATLLEAFHGGGEVRACLILATVVPGHGRCLRPVRPGEPERASRLCP